MAVPSSSLPSKTRTPSYTIPGKWPGLVAPGNIDLGDRPVVHNPDGSISTVKSFSIGVGPHEVLLPMVVGGKVVSIPAAIAAYRQTGQNLGTFASIPAANAYAQALHQAQAKEYLPQGLVLPKLPISQARAGMAIWPPESSPIQLRSRYNWTTGKYEPNPGFNQR